MILASIGTFAAPQAGGESTYESNGYSALVFPNNNGLGS